ncbi:hypothetical protein ACVNF4_13535 [Streptomyces sp. S6]
MCRWTELDALVSAHADRSAPTPAEGAALPRAPLLDRRRTGRTELAAVLRDTLGVIGRELSFHAARSTPSASN